METDHTFKYSFELGRDAVSQTLKVPINVEDLQLKNVAELCARLARFHQIPCFVNAEMTSLLKKYVDENLSKLKNTNSSDCVNKLCKNPDLVKQIGNAAAEKYRKTWVRYSQLSSNQLNDFPQAYHYLIHSSAMQILLKLERKFHADLAKVIVDKEQSLVKMQERHQLEMARVCEHVGFAYSNEDVTELASRHLADSERLLAHWDNKYVDLTTTQREQFHHVLIDLHREMEANNHTIDDSGQAFNKIKKVIDENTVVSFHSNNDSTPSQVTSASSIASSISTSASSRSIEMEESFTINLGAQLKTMHNIRLMVTDILSFSRFSNDGEMEAQRFQTAMSLYSTSLSALILIADPRLGYQTGVQKEFSSICYSSTEFHFKSLREQMADVRKEAMTCRNNLDAQSREEEDLCLQEGDFYITKHSNLSQVHLVFHLVADETALQTKSSLSNVTSRHPVITSLRQILKVASSHDIGTITLPLLLTHELTEEITFQWCVKRAELVMKCIKGFMMEMATWDGGVSRTIQFVIPPGVSEEVFDRLRSTLPEVFRTTSSRDLTRSRPVLSK